MSRRKLYLVRWPNLEVTLVSAENEDDLIDQLDEEGDPSGCKWWIYNGPLYLSLRVPIDWKWDESREGADEVVELPLATVYFPKEAPKRDNFLVEKIPEELFGVEAHLDLKVDPGETGGGYEMQQKIVKRAFPHLAKVYEDDSDDSPATEEQVREAIKSELMDGMNRSHEATVSLLQAVRSGDRDAALAMGMGTSLEFVRSCCTASENEGDKSKS